MLNKSTGAKNCLLAQADSSLGQIDPCVLYLYYDPFIHST